jgi:hypothetical protein
MNPPFLVIRPGKAFWVEPRHPQDARATLGAFAEGCYADTRWYDAIGGVWTVVEATLRNAPSLLDRALQRPVPVALRFGPRGEGDLTGALMQLHEVLQSDNDFCESLPNPAEEIRAQFDRARTMAELVDVASRLK